MTVARIRSHARAGTVIFAVLLLIAAHAALIGFAGAHFSLAVATGVVGVVLLKYAWWKFWR